MGKRVNDLFLENYIRLDHECSEKLGTVTGGVTEYINKLNGAKYVTGKDEVLPRLVRYRNLRNRFAHEPGAIRKIDELNASDVRWVIRFKREIKRNRDPLSRYLRKARRFVLRRRALKALIVGASVAITVAAVVILIRIF